MVYLRPITPETFWARVRRNELSGCWEWIGKKHSNGYGRFSQGHKPRQWFYAHRYAYLLANSKWDGKGHILHRCDNPPCVNPAHLFIGTQADNVHDMWAKGRGSKPPQHPQLGERNKLAKLTAADVVAIRGSTLSRRELAALHGVNQKTIDKIILRQRWRHL